jgi:hypothetical protein
MNTKRQRLARLEKLVAPYIQQKKQQEQARIERVSQAASYHAIRLGALVLRGDPKLDEPLEAAWARCLAEFGVLPAIKLFGNSEFGDAFCLRVSVLRDLPGDTELQKYQNLFDMAPPWLLRFTQAFKTAQALGIKLPDLSGTPHRGHLGFREGNKWPELPKGTLQAGDPISELTMLTPEQNSQLFELLEKPEEEWTRHERRLYREIMGLIHAKS